MADNTVRKIPCREIYERIAKLDAFTGLYVEAIESGEVVEINPNRALCSASIIKLPILALALKDVEEGRLDWKKTYQIASANRVGGTGVLRELDEIREASLEKLAFLMIALSDNIAANQVIDLVGMDRITPFCRSLGYTNTRCERKQLDMQAIREGRNNYTSAGDAGRMLSAVARGELVNPVASRLIHSIMSRQMCRNKLPAKIPAIAYWAVQDGMTLPAGSVLAANKTGELLDVQHDAGIFTLPDGRRYVIAMLTGEVKDANDAVNAIADISRIVYDAMK